MKDGLAREVNWRKVFADARKTLEAIERFEREERGVEGLDADGLGEALGVDPGRKLGNESKAEQMARRRWLARDALLRRTVPERKCWKCGRTKLRSRQWVLLSRSWLAVYSMRAATGGVDPELLRTFVRRGAICRACFVKHLALPPGDVAQKKAAEKFREYTEVKRRVQEA